MLVTLAASGGLGIAWPVLCFLIVIIISFFVGLWGAWKRDVYGPYAWGVFMVLFAIMNLGLLLWHNGG